ncbi:MAG TPA: hypothetical protein ENI32_06130 [Candidatus Syntrophoarchaeum butanivorans]|uniref:Stage II sporulation protein E n=1 Tax=Candidatus Syntropharchaeum butanivorans TaxID=1839936 RepID=A0A1F2P6B3_9EURY|nr:MAG: stage II sporulation protein E [Candidatus Syntrophoarchaeum butanivorans]HEC57441.1 hypothetical protein [Candidatus Syntrophoarchaeum butanivorans]
MVEVRLGLATRPAIGYTENGDGHFVEQWDGKLLLAVFDGLGHGKVAAEAAERCRAVLKQVYQRKIPEIFEVCHEELRRMRGVVMGIARIELSTLLLNYAGVGNITMKIVGHEENTHLISMDGIVGYNLPGIRVFPYQLTRGDIIMMYTDGISSSHLSGYSKEKIRSYDPQILAEEILNRCSKPEDDATVLILHV